MKRRIHTYREYIGIVILSLLPMMPMLLNQNHLHTSDGAMHLARIAAYYKEVVNGQFPVRWASDLNYGYGTPLFNFFHPLPYIITAFFVALGSSLSYSLRLSFLFSYLLSGLFALLFAKTIFKDRTISFVIAVLYQFAPFRLVDIIIRGSLGGVYSYALLPLILYAVSSFISKRSVPWLILISLSTALLSLSHNIIGFTFFGVSLIVSFILAKNLKERILITIAMFWGVILSVWFVAPVFLEQKYTYGYLFTKDLYKNHFVPLYKLFIPNLTNTPSLRIAEVPVQIGIIHTIGLLLALPVIFFKTYYKRYTPLFITLLGGSALIIFFTNSASAFFWENIPILAQFQYPWRLLSVITFTSALLSASFFLIVPTKFKTIMAYILCVAAVVTTIPYWNPPEGYDKINESYWWNYPLTTNYYGEVDTIWSDGPAKTYPAQTVIPIEGKAEIKPILHKGVTYSYTIDAKTDSTILQNTQYFPGWSVFVDGTKTPIEFQNQLHRGKITFRVAKGMHSVKVIFSQSGIQKISDFISLFSIGTTILIFIKFRKYHV